MNDCSILPRIALMRRRLCGLSSVVKPGRNICRPRFWIRSWRVKIRYMSGESFEALHKANLEQRQESARLRYRKTKLESAIRHERGGSFLTLPFRLSSMISYRWTNMRHTAQNQGTPARIHTL